MPGPTGRSISSSSESSSADTRDVITAVSQSDCNTSAKQQTVTGETAGIDFGVGGARIPDDVMYD